MENRRGDKIIEIEEYLEELESFLPSDFEKYIGNVEKRAACERYFEKVVKAVVDLAFIVIRECDFKSPEFDREAFEILATEKIISEELSLNLGNAKSMRNWLAHQYDKIDNRKVFDAINDKLFYDVRKFLEMINDR